MIGKVIPLRRSLPYEQRQRSWLMGLLVGPIVAGGVFFALVDASGADSSTSATSTTTSSVLMGPQVPQAAAPGVEYTSVSCPNDSTCVAVGTGSNTGVAATSGDGGHTWTTLTLPSQTPGLAAVSCGTPTNCVAVGANTLLTSSDGGSSWSAQAPPVVGTTLYGVTCAATNLCIAAGVHPNAVGPYSGEIAISHDGGVSWTGGDLPDGTPALASVACPSGTRCIAVGATILTTDDSGATWQQRTVNGGMQSLVSIACQSSSTCIAVGPNIEGTQNPSASDAAIISSDSGDTWNAQPFPSGTAGIGRITCVSGGICEAVGAPVLGGAPVLAMSAGDPTQWVSSPAPSLSSVQGISCSSSTHCVAVGSSNSSPASVTSSSSATWSSGASVS